MSTTLTLIAAVSADGFISRGEGVPWDLPADKQQFRDYTRGKWLLLGRKTYEEMLGWFSAGHYPLVMSRDAAFIPFVGQRVAHVTEALSLAEQAHQTELVVLGGSGAFDAAMPLADRLILTHVDEVLGSGAAFPEVVATDWEPVSRFAHEVDGHHAWRFEIVTYQRVRHYHDAA